jgi:hypothetical protein
MSTGPEPKPSKEPDEDDDDGESKPKQPPATTPPSTACADEGSMAGCPGGTVCKRVTGGAGACLLVCADDEGCPEKTKCVGVPGSSLKACEPKS